MPKLFFLAITLLYLSFSPGTVSGMGYMAENLEGADRIITTLTGWQPLHSNAGGAEWTRHGFIELLFEVPFLLLSRLVFGPSLEWANRILAIQPVVMTSLICTLILVWVRKITSSSAWGYLLAAAAGFSTLLWPYAYIGLETTQSFFLLMAGYLAFAQEGKRSWPRAFLLVLSCAIAVSVKLNGFFLAPAMLFVVATYFWGQAGDRKRRWPQHSGKLTGAILIVGVIFALNAYTRSVYFAGTGGSSWQYASWMVRGPMAFSLNALSFICSPNKGLIVYSPLIILCLAALRRAYLEDKRIVMFTLFTMAGLGGGFSLLFAWSDETWGPRYLHSAIAPLVVCLALTKKAAPLQMRRQLPLLVLVALGVWVSFLGVFFYYGALHQVAVMTSGSTIEALQYDPNWNHIRFNMRLLRVWAQGPHTDETKSSIWGPTYHWWFRPPPDALPPKIVHLGPFAVPQPSIIREWGISKEPAQRAALWVYGCSFGVGLVLLAWVGRMAFNSARAR